MVFGHLGDGNLHYNIAPPVGASLAELRDTHGEAITRCVFDHVAALGGSFSAEHGVGLSKKPSMKRRKDPVALDIMRAVKAAVDPGNRMNPGKIIPE